MKRKMKKYDIFISYRREGGLETAKHLRDSLVEKGYRVFFDMESLRAGPFNEELYRVIENSKDFLLVLPPHALDRCENESDWVRLEIEHAKKCGKNIVPIMLKGFDFPEKLPESIDFVRMQSGLAANIDYYDAFISRLEEFLQSKPWLPKSKRWIPAVLSLVVLGFLIFGGYKYYTTYPRTASERNTVSALIDYMVYNLKKYDVAADQYQKELDKAQMYIEGKTTDSADDISYRLYWAADEIEKARKGLTDISSDLRSQLTKSSKFDVGDLDAFKNVLSDTMDEYCERLNLIRENYLTDDALRIEHRSAFIDICRSMAKYDAEIIFYNLNESLLPVTNDSALSDLKTQYLPELTVVNNNRLSLSKDADDVAGKEAAIFQQYEKLVEQYSESVQEEKDYIEKAQMSAEDQAYIDGVKKETIGLSEQLKGKQEEAYQVFRPLETDDGITLWNKGKRFLSVNMPYEAAECFDLYADKSSGDEKKCGVNAAKLARNWEEIGISGGVMVFLYEEGKAHQAVEIGDIIYAVDDVPVKNYTEYFAAKEAETEHSLSILRFIGGSYEFVDSVLSPDLGQIGVWELTDEPAQS